MGSAASTIIEVEAARPADASDLKSDAEARAEVIVLIDIDKKPPC